MKTDTPYLARNYTHHWVYFEGKDSHLKDNELFSRFVVGLHVVVSKVTHIHVFVDIDVLIKPESITSQHTV